jgi:hypothetical protein
VNCFNFFLMLYIDFSQIICKHIIGNVSMFPYEEDISMFYWVYYNSPIIKWEVFKDFVKF